jgi:ATP-binding cassette subfamily C protein LapB
MTRPAMQLIEALAARQGISLPIGWDEKLSEDLSVQDPDFVERLCGQLGWDLPASIVRKPRANDFPLLVYSDQHGWCLGEQWHSASEIRLITASGVDVVAYDAALHVARVAFPKEVRRHSAESAFDIFVGALAARKRALIDAGIATLVINVIALSTSLFSMQIYDRVIPQGGFATLWVLTAGVAIALLFDFAIRNARATLVDREAAAIDAEISEFFFARMQAIRLDRRPPGIGTTAAQMRGLDQVRSMMASATLFILADLPFALLFMAVMALIGGSVVIVSMVLFPLALSFANLFSRFIREATARSQSTSYQKNGILVEALDAGETIKTNLGDWQMLARWNQLVDKVDEDEQQVRLWSTRAASTFNLLQQVAYVAIVVIGAYRVGLGEMTMGGLIACTIISGRINGPLVSALPNLLLQWEYARGSLGALDRILSAPSDHQAGSRSIKLRDPKGQLRAENIEFAYPDSRNGVALEKLEIKPGERIAVIGPIGSGKSTFLRLLAGLYAPQRGQILLDGLEISQIAHDDLRRNIYYLPQDFRVISGTLRDNLTLGIPSPSDNDLLDAAQQTGLISLINGHPRGLDMPVGEGGRGLSGGQRTLVGLTRVLLLKPRLLMLDEPTANLDQESEARVMHAILRTLSSTTSLVLVTHKAQLLSLANRIILFAEGRIALDGPNQAVIETLQKQAAAVAASADRTAR